jgi:hypothetical protein
MECEGDGTPVEGDSLLKPDAGYSLVGSLSAREPMMIR